MFVVLLAKIEKKKARQKLYRLTICAGHAFESFIIQLLLSNFDKGIPLINLLIDKLLTESLSQ